MKKDNHLLVTFMYYLYLL